MVTDEQVKLLMSLLNQGNSQVTAAVKAGMSERTARKYAHSGATPSQAKAPHTWRTRPDPLEEVWPAVAEQLHQEPRLQAKTLWEWLQRTQPADACMFWILAISPGLVDRERRYCGYG